MLILQVLQGPDKGRLFELPDNEPQMIGRSSESLPLADQTISRRHAALTPDDGAWYIVDLQSANGTFVNGKRVKGRKILQPGDQVRTGLTLFVFGMDEKSVKRRGVSVLQPEQIDAHIEKALASNSESMVMAVGEPNEAAALQLRVVYELTELMGTISDRQTLLEKIMDLIFQFFQADRGFIILQESPDERSDPVVVRHDEVQADGKPVPITVSRTIVEHVIRLGEGILSSNAMTDRRFAGGDSIQEYGIRSAICVPITFKDRIFGVIHIDSQIANYTFTEDQLRLCNTIGTLTGMALANAEMYEERVQQARLAAVGQTVASLSHSTKNILQGIRGGGDLVEMGLKRKNLQAIKGGWEIVSRNLERIYELTMNMLAFSKQRKPEFEMVTLNTLLDEIVTLVQKQFDAKQVALITDYDPDMPPVPLDPGGIHQALLNLLNNALDAVEPERGVVTLKCHYEVQKDRQFIRIAVIDNGVGIEPDRLDRVFQPFQSTKGLKGTGLGLVVTKKIVEEHGGTIQVESTPREGATFTLNIPLHVEDNANSTMAETIRAVEKDG